jgi:hypothetical protein
MVVQTKKYRKCTLQSISRSEDLLKLQKGPKFGQKEDKKYKIIHFEANFPFETL